MEALRVAGRRAALAKRHGRVLGACEVDDVGHPAVRPDDAPQIWIHTFRLDAD
jgi:hypothetical protein